LPEKKYGRTVCVLQPQSGTIAPDYVKSEISNLLLEYMGLPTRLIIQDPDYYYCSVTSNVQYDDTATSYLPSDIEALVLAAIQSYSSTNLATFEGNLRYSKFTAAIDNADISIVSNQTELLLIKRLTPYPAFPTSYSINFNNAANLEVGSLGTVTGEPYETNPVITSSPFTYTDANNVNWPNSYMRDDCLGNIVVYTTVNNVFTVLNPTVGTIAYSTGVVAINNLITASYGNYISVYLQPLNADLIISLSGILMIDPNDCKITVNDETN